VHGLAERAQVSHLGLVKGPRSSAGMFSRICAAVLGAETTRSTCGLLRQKRQQPLAEAAGPAKPLGFRSSLPQLVAVNVSAMNSL